MFKKTIAGILSAVMCTSALLCEMPAGGRESVREADPLPAASQDVQADGLSASNAFARYLMQKPTENKSGTAPLKASAAESVFAVADLEFDRETGTIRTVTTQSEKCRIVVAFADQDQPSNIYTVSYDVDAGTYVHSTFSADTAKLPEYFTISAYLTNRADLPVSDTFTLDRFTREMQEILAKTTADFAPEQIVNFDDDTSTNFAVLSEETVKADTTETSNLLVSADYKQNTYVFDKIDDTIRSLESGQYFFSRPTENDLIAIQVTDVQIDGETASVTGTESLDGMFDFIKIEEEGSTPMLIDSAQDSTAASEDEALHTSEKRYLAEGDAPDPSDTGAVMQYINNDADVKGGSVNFVPSVNKQTTVNGLMDVSAKLNGTVTWKYNFFFQSNLSLQKLLHFDIGRDDFYAVAYFVITYDFQASLSGQTKSLNLSKKEQTPNPPFNPDNYPTDGIGIVRGASFTIPTNIPGLTIQVEPVFRMSASLDFEVGFKKQVTRGFYCDTRYGFRTIQHESEENGVTLKLHSELHFQLDLTFRLSYFDIVSAYIQLGIKLTPHCSVDTQEKESPNAGGRPKSGDTVFACADTSSLTQHVCDYCLSGYINAVISGETGIDINADPIIDYHNAMPFGPTNFILGPFYCSAIYNGTVFKLDPGVGNCPHYANKTTVHVYFTGEAAGQIATLRIGKSGSIDEYDIGGSSFCEKIFYTVPDKTVIIELVLEGATIRYSPDNKKWYKVAPNTTGAITIHADIPMTSTTSSTTRTITTETFTTTTTTFTILPPPPTTPTTPTTTKTTETTTQTTETTTATTETVTTTTTEETSGSWPVTTTTTTVTDITTTGVTTTEPIATDNNGDPQPPPPEYIIESVRLGDYIYANLYNNGEVYAFGCGDMYETFSKSPFKNVAKIRAVYLVSSHMPDVTLSDEPEETMTASELTLQNALRDGVINSIGKNVFSGAAALTKLWMITADENRHYIPSRITIISKNAFKNCAVLSSIIDFSRSTNEIDVMLPQELAEIGEEAFSGCTNANFGDLTLPQTIRSIGQYAFKDCQKLTAITVPGTSAPTIADYAFYNCNNLRTAVLNDGIASIGQTLFHDCYSLQSVTLPYCGKNISDTSHHFYEYFGSGTKFSSLMYEVYSHKTSHYYVPKSLTEITVTGGTQIPDGFFRKMKYVQSITIPDNITSIGKYAFMECTNLEIFSIPDAVTAIGERAFRNCAKAFTELDFSENIESIGKYAFSGCTGVESLRVPGDSHPVIGICAFHNCIKLKTAELCDGIASIGDYIFYDCYSLQSLTIPYFGGSATRTDGRFYKLFGTARGTDYRNLMYEIYRQDNYTGGASIGYAPKALTEITVTGGTVIPNSFFSKMEYVKSITVPETLTEIGSSAFKECKQLENFRIPETVTTIGQDAFFNCEQAFTKLDFSENIQSIGKEAFSGCTSLRSVYIPGSSAPVIGDAAFKNCTGLGTAVFCDGIASIGERVLHDCCALESLTLPYCGRSATDADGRFYEYFGSGSDYKDRMYSIRSSSSPHYFAPNSLTKITVTGGTTVPGRFFQDMSELVSITLPAQTALVQDYAFSGCTALAEAYLLGENADWDNVEILNTKNGNQPLLDLVRGVRTVAVLADPLDQNVHPNETAAFWIYAVNAAEMNYQWQYSADNGETWTNADSMTDCISFLASLDQDGHLFRCIVTDANGNSVESAAALLKVTELEIDPETQELPEGFLLGDVNCDGYIDENDINLLAGFLIGDTSVSVSELGLLNGDFNGDGMTNNDDLTALMLFLSVSETEE